MSTTNVQTIKQRFGIIGNHAALNRAIDVAIQVAPTDLTVLVTGESGTGKEIMPQIIHNLSARKHGPYIAVNCGAIPEGTIDSELFGHEKGSFTGAVDSRKGYFEVANGGTIFLDEVAELPLQTQVRLLRVLETGEFIKVGSSKVIKTDVRIIAATNVNIPEAIRKGKFREDLYYRLNTVPISIPALRDRRDDVHLLFRKFANDFAEKYRMPPIKLTDEAVEMLTLYAWPGNIRQLKNITEQISVIESERTIGPELLAYYLPKENGGSMPVHLGSTDAASELTEREILYKVLFDMKNDLNDLKGLVFELMQNNSGNVNVSTDKAALINRLFKPAETSTAVIHTPAKETPVKVSAPVTFKPDDEIDDHQEVEESLSLQDREVELIKKALQKHRNKRKYAARELGISERTLYRKIREFDIK
ncbi:MAG TPA: sigma-54 dependent transcriptional regulator [Flavobacteriales bacterium]|nr:sigma-54 dependent transcriptional regulator [Flavobacteriales bacterium]